MSGPTVKILIGDAAEKLRELPSDSVHCMVTSPPYYSLRSYSRCRCSQAKSAIEEEHSGLNCGARTPRYKHTPDPDCPLCHGSGEILGVKDKEIGLEETPQAYVARLVDVFREIKRVLRPDGVAWLNLGDSYAGSWGNSGHRADLDGGGSKQRGKDTEYFQRRGYDDHRVVPPTAHVAGIAAKSLIMIPSRVGLALQEEGWIVRCDVIWEKRNSMPESASDRPTRNHEYIFQLTRNNEAIYWMHRDGRATRKKPAPDYRWVDLITDTEYTAEPADYSAELITCPVCKGEGEIHDWLGDDECPECGGDGEVRHWAWINLWSGHDYYYDPDPIREPLKEESKRRVMRGNSPENKYAHGVERPTGVPPNTLSQGREYVGYDNMDERINAGLTSLNPLGRNKRSVWRMNTQPSSEEHYASFPEELPETCIRASTSEKGCCPQCGAPYARRTVKVRPENWVDQGVQTDKERAQRDIAKAIYGGNQKTRSISDIYNRALQSGIRELGWQPTCECNAGAPVPCTVLDPFGGSGTVGVVARRLGRSSVLIDLNPIYEKMMRRRTMADIAAIESFGGEKRDG